MPKLSVVIPTFNEGKTNYLPNVLAVFEGYNDVEVIVSDGGSTDNTISTAEKASAQIIQDRTLSRAQRINNGVKNASGELVLINHPRSILFRDGLEYLLENHLKLSWGGFTHRFDKDHPFLKFTSWYSNNVRARFGPVVYLDHCKFVKKALLDEVLPLPAVDIFEDTILSKRLFKVAGAPTILKHEVITSAIRFTENGMIKQGLINQYLKLAFMLGQDHKNMNKLYEKDVALNTKYDD